MKFTKIRWWKRGNLVKKKKKRKILPFLLCTDQSSRKRTRQGRGAWMAQLVRHPASDQVMISRFMSWSPTLGSLLTAESLLWILCPLVFLCLSPASHTHSLSLKNEQTFKKIKKRKRTRQKGQALHSHRNPQSTKTIGHVANNQKTNKCKNRKSKMLTGGDSVYLPYHYIKMG